MRTHNPNIRLPAVAGRFYPAQAEQLIQEVRALLASGSTGNALMRACAVMVPHAGYVYSGGVAGKVFGQIAVPERIILLCPNHTGMGERIALIDRGVFRIPGADVPIDSELAAAILRELPAAAVSAAAHRFEHAIEVELPFLVARQPLVRMVPIALSQLSESDAMELGRALYRACASIVDDPRDQVLIVASSDMSHYLPDTEARRVDQLALAPLLSFDPSGLYRTVVKNDISMCGFVPATAMLSYAHELNAKAPRLVSYATSGEAFGDTSRVVGYAGVIVAP